MLTGHGIGIFNGEGLAASHAAIFPIGLARAGDGSLLIANDYGRVVAITGAASALAAVAITGTRVSPRRLTVEFTSTVAGRAHLAVAGREVDTAVRHWQGDAHRAGAGEAGGLSRRARGACATGAPSRSRLSAC